MESVDLGWSQNLNEAFYDLFRSELAALYGHHLAKWRNRMYPFIVQLIEEADSLHARRMEHIQKIRIDLWESLRVLFTDHDALLCPTTSVPAPKVGQSELDYYERVDDGRCHALEMTFQFNLVPQCPAISVPSGFTASGLPTGLQIVGRRYDDETVLRIAAALEESRPWNDKRPAVETATAASAHAHLYH